MSTLAPRLQQYFQPMSWMPDSRLDIHPQPLDRLLAVIPSEQHLAQCSSNVIFFPIHLSLERQEHHLLALIHPWIDSQQLDLFSQIPIHQNMTQESIAQTVSLHLDKHRFNPQNCLHLTSEYHFDASISSIKRPSFLMHKVALKHPNNTGVYFDLNERTLISQRLAQEYFQQLTYSIGSLGGALSVLEVLDPKDARFTPLQLLAQDNRAFESYWSALYEHALEKNWLHYHTQTNASSQTVHSTPLSPPSTTTSKSAKMKLL